MLDGRHAGKTVSFNEVRDRLFFSPEPRHLSCASLSSEDFSVPEPLKPYEYRIAFYSVDRQTLFYSTDGTPQSLFRGDWIVRKDAYGDRPQTVEYLSGVTVHQKREVQSWVARLRGLIKSEVTGKEFRGGVDYICTEIERLLNMPVGNAS